MDDLKQAHFLDQLNDLLLETKKMKMNEKVRDFMRPYPIVIKSTATLKDAIEIIIDNKIDGVPVVDEDNMMVGLVTKTLALREINKSDDLNQNIGKIMKTDPFVTEPDEDISTLITVNVACLPVISDRKVVGMVTLSDTVRAYFSSIINLKEELDTVINSAYNGIITIDTGGNVRLINQAAEKILGMQKTDVWGRPLARILPDANLDDVVQSGKTVFGQKIKFKDRILVMNKSPLAHKDNIIGAVAVFQDISDFEMISEELDFTKNLKEELAAIIESSFDGIYLTDSAGKILRVNDAFTRITGIETQELLDKTVDELVARGVFAHAIPFKDLADGRPVTISQEVRTGKTILVTSNPIMDADGRVSRIVHNARDITELNNFRNKLEQAQSLSDHYREQLHKMKTSNKYITKAQSSKALIELVMRLGAVDTTVLITGESGVGKEIIAEILHENSDRRDKLMVTVNCAAIPENLLESELFGYEAGAFTGASRKGRSGAFEVADGGIIFLDEISELPLNLQSKILRALQQKEITRLGGNKPLKVDVRIIAATNQDLLAMVKRKEFRNDLFYRLNVIPINILPLRDRKEEIPDFVSHFTKLFNKKYNLNKRFDERAVHDLMQYNWPGNVRELQNIIERNMITSEKDVIKNLDFGEDKPDRFRPDAAFKEPAAILKLKTAVENLERDIISDALLHHGTSRRAAHALGISQPTIVRKASKYRIKMKT
ncbi:MAG TPA: sigma 54-interacting transcriptional regulator [Smithella sp.]|nr:sigma 54-interacting transcriptional regulator [Smithella sp.]